jgi:hypothetical protein
MAYLFLVIGNNFFRIDMIMFAPMVLYLCSYGLDLCVRLIHGYCQIPFDKSHIMDDVDVHLLLFPYSICTSMGKKVNARKL